MKNLFASLQKWFVSPSTLASIEPVEKALGITPTTREIVDARDRLEKLLNDLQYDTAQLRGFVESKIVASKPVDQPPTLLLD